MEFVIEWLIFCYNNYVKRGKGVIGVFFIAFLGMVGFVSAAQLQSINFVPQGSYPTCARGTIFYSSSTDQFMLCTSSGGQPSPLVTGASNLWTLSGSNLYPMTTSYSVVVGGTTVVDKLDVVGNLGVGGSSFSVGTMNGVSGQGIAFPSTNNDSVRIVGEYTNPDTSNGIFWTGDNVNDGWKFRESDCCGGGTLDYLIVQRASPQIAIYSTTTDISSIGVVNGFTTFTSSGSNPGYRFTGGTVDVNGGLQSTIYYDRDNTNYYMDLANNTMPYSLVTAGEVGIGTTAPNGLLQVGQGSASSTRRDIWIGSSYPLTMQSYTDNSAQADIFHNAYVNGGSGSSPVFIWATTHASFGSRGIGFSYGSGGITFYADNAATTQGVAFTPTARMIIQNTGNVGIGTMSPGYKLVVSGGSIAIDQGQALRAVNGNWLIGSDTNGNISIGSTQVANNITFNSSSSTGSVIATFLNSGNVGIGITGPLAKLEISSSTGSGTEGDLLRLNAVSGNAGNGPGILFTNNNDVLNIARIAGLDSGNWGGNLVFYTSPQTGSSPGGTPTERMRILYNGYVGIGTTAPTTAGLVVATNMSGAAVDVQNNRIINVGTPVNAADAATKSYVDSIVATATSTQYWILSGSNLYPNSTSYGVGIGTASPYDKLAVSGNIGQLFSGTYGDSWGNFNLIGSMDMTSYPFYQTAGKTYQGLQIANSSDNLFLGLENNGSNLQQAIIGWGDDSDNTLQFRFNNGTIGSVSPSGAATFNSAVNTSIFYDRDNTNYYLDPAANVMPYALNTGGGINIGGGGTFSGALTVNGANVTLSSATQLVINSTSSAAIQMNQGSITGVYKLSVAVVDPLYNIGGVNYSTYAASITGGVKEEYVGQAQLVSSSQYSVDSMQNTKYEIPNTTYSYVIDFDNVAQGSDLWVWRKAVNFGPDTIQAFATPIGTPVPIAYQMDGNKIIFISRIPNTDYQIPDTGIEFSYRLIGSRFDWKDWPTLSKDQSEKAALIIQ